MLFLNPLMLLGALLAVGPLVLHLVHRRRVRRIWWGAMHLLDVVQARIRRRLAMQQFLLLAVRTALLSALSLIFVRPSLVGPPAGPDRLVRQGRTAAVLLIDDSLSSGCGRERTRLADALELARTYLASLRPGDEVSLLRLSEIGAAAADPFLDLAAARAALDRIRPTLCASDVPRLLEAGMGQLTRHLNPGTELVLVTDGAADGWRSRERGRWSDLRRRLGVGGEAAPGSRNRPRLLLLTPSDRGDESDVAVVELGLDRSLVGVGTPIGIRVGLFQRGKTSGDCLVSLMVDGRPAASRSVKLIAGIRQVLTFSQTFDRPGSQVVEAVVEGGRDQLPANDRRTLAVEVVQGLPVRLVESTGGEGLHGSLGFVQVALDPRGDGRGLFRVDRRSLAGPAFADLDSCRVLVLGDPGLLDSDGLARIEAFVAGGGGLLTTLGSQTDLTHLNRFWARSGDGFLPCPIKRWQQSDPGRRMGWLDVGHPAMAAFVGRDSRAFAEALVRRVAVLDLARMPSEEIQVVARLDDDLPLVVERSRGQGQSILIATSLDLAANDLATDASFVPFLRGLVGHLGGRLRPDRNLVIGERLIHPGRSGGSSPPTLVGPQGNGPDLEPGIWQGRPVFTSAAPLTVAGTWTVRDGENQVHYAVATDPAESLGDRLDPAMLAQTLEPAALLRCEGLAELQRHLGQVQSERRELWPWLVALVLLLLGLEAWLTSRAAYLESEVLPPPRPDDRALPPRLRARSGS